MFRKSENKSDPSPPSPTIALLTDFGTSDWYAAAMKGVIATLAPRARTIDITHDIDPGNVRAAAFVLSQCYETFPKGTIFLCVVDPGVGSSRKPIILYTGDYYFVAPDNGLLALLKPCMRRAFEIDLTRMDLKANPSHTFHGRDIFAPAAALLAAGASPSDIAIPMPGFGHSGMELDPIADLPCDGQVIYFDHFGNAISNLRINEFSPIPRHAIIAGNKKIPFVKSYSDVKPGSPLAYLGSCGLVEIAVNQGNARIALNLDSESDFQLL